MHDHKIVLQRKFESNLEIMINTFLFFQLVTNICEISSRYGEKDLALTVGFSHVFFPNEALERWVDRRDQNAHGTSRLTRVATRLLSLVLSVRGRR